jgi:single-strand DNA-binding protein
MSALNLNKVILAGHLTNDPELKQTPSGVSTTTIRLAVNRRYSKEGNNEADFITIVAWRQTAEFVCRYFKKRSAILVTGAIQTRTWTDKDGGNRYAVEIVADEAMFVDGKTSADGEKNAQKEPMGFSARPSVGTPNFENIPNDEGLPF